MLLLLQLVLIVRAANVAGAGVSGAVVVATTCAADVVDVVAAATCAASAVAACAAAACAVAVERLFKNILPIRAKTPSSAALSAASPIASPRGASTWGPARCSSSRTTGKTPFMAGARGSTSMWQFLFFYF